MIKHIIEIITYKYDNPTEEVGRYYGIHESRAAGVEVWSDKHGYELASPTADVYPTGDHYRSEYHMTPVKTGFEALVKAPELRVTVGDVRRTF
jgi:hypothetical protein